ncbi:hypothetical protein [Methylobacterium marchantiae]|uniref:Uncharacterized protein n=1 Tax=Methylobacterium marchantiae TaxID=600331 RepID=A0ABW3WZV0_9HYPH|nr:hypothetical protein AIGOOFII_2048 [Methylobacterium marchantiae]
MTKRTLVLAGLVLAGLLLVGLAAAVFGPKGRSEAPASGVVRTDDAPQPSRKIPTLYCEFYNFVGRSPKVGFTFAVTDRDSRPDFAQVSQFEMDGSRAEFGRDTPRPAWAFDDAQVPATLTSPDGAIVINLYAYDRTKSGGAWFEAGLRSVQYLNLDGKCRQGAA